MLKNPAVSIFASNLSDFLFKNFRKININHVYIFYFCGFTA